MPLSLPEPLPHQQQILNDPSRFKVVVCGRRWGKTACGLEMAIEGHGASEAFRRGANWGGNIWWVAPAFPIAQDIWRDLKRATAGRWSDKDEVERRLELPSGGAVTVKSADRPDSLRGAGLDGLIVDETATVKHEAWREALRPALSDKKGWATFFGTPKGYNWFYDLYAEAEGRENWARWQRPSSDNPLMDAEELAEALKDIGSFAFGQEYLAQFVTDGAGIFKREWLCRFVDNEPRDPGIRAVRYWDKAGGVSKGSDYSSGVLIVESGGLFYVADVVRGKWSPFERDKVIEATCEQDATHYHRVKSFETWIEQEPGHLAIQVKMLQARQLARFAPRFDKVNKSKEVRARPFAAACEAGLVHFAREKWNREFIDELVQFQPNNPDRNAHDDQVDAASGAYFKLITVPDQGPIAIPRGFVASGR